MTLYSLEMFLLRIGKYSIPGRKCHISGDQISIRQEAESALICHELNSHLPFLSATAPISTSKSISDQTTYSLPKSQQSVF